MIKELDEVKKIFLAGDVDDEIRLDNEEQILKWEKDLYENEVLADWINHDITKMIIQQAKNSYKEISLTLALNRRLDDEQRKSLWGKQDAMLWLISLGSKDPQKEIESIKNEIKTAINAV